MYERLKDFCKNNMEDWEAKYNVACNIMNGGGIGDLASAFLRDDSSLYDRLPDVNKKALVNMMYRYFKSVYSSITDRTYVRLTSIIKKSKTRVYSIRTYEGRRLATKKEVEYGVKGLIETVKDVIEPSVVKHLAFLGWFMSGYWSFYRTAGYNVEYNEDGEVITNPYSVLQKHGSEINEMFDFFEKNTLKAVLRDCEKRIREYKYVEYLSYAPDEVIESVTPKQLMFSACEIFERGSSDKDVRRAFAICLRYRSNKWVTPGQISFVREIYEEQLKEYKKRSSSTLEQENKKDIALEDKCEFLLGNRFGGNIDREHFCYKIISTLKRCGYTRASKNQMRIIDEAIEVLSMNGVDYNGLKPVEKASKSNENLEVNGNINKIEDNETEHADIVDIEDNDDGGAFSLYNLSAMLGSGMLSLKE